MENSTTTFTHLSVIKVFSGDNSQEDNYYLADVYIVNTGDQKLFLIDIGDLETLEKSELENYWESYCGIFKTPHLDSRLNHDDPNYKPVKDAYLNLLKTEFNLEVVNA